MVVDNAVDVVVLLLATSGYLGLAMVNASLLIAPCTPRPFPLVLSQFVHPLLIDVVRSVVCPAFEISGHCRHPCPATGSSR